MLVKFKSSCFYFGVLKKVVDLVVGEHEKPMQTTKACKGNASILFFLFNGRLRNCRQIYECKFGLIIYREKMKKFQFCLVKFTSKHTYCKQSCMCQAFIHVLGILIDCDS